VRAEEAGDQFSDDELLEMVFLHSIADQKLSARATERFAREDTIVAGTTIPHGDLVLAVLASANRDNRQFKDPDKLDLAREPNCHLAFGYGVHYCLGAPLARLEGQISISTLLRRIPDLQLAKPADALPWKRGLVLRGLESLPVVFSKRKK